MPQMNYLLPFVQAHILWYQTLASYNTSRHLFPYIEQRNSLRSKSFTRILYWRYL